MLKSITTIVIASASLFISHSVYAQKTHSVLDLASIRTPIVTSIDNLTVDKRIVDKHLIDKSRADTSQIDGLELLKKIGDYPNEPAVFIARTPSAHEISERLASSKRFAEATGERFSAKPALLGDNRLALIGTKDTSASFEVDRLTGNFLFESGMSKYSGEYSTPSLPKDSNLERLAMRTLDQYDLKVNPKELKVAHVGGLNMSAANGEDRPEIYEKLKTIRFERVLDGLPVMGDSRLVMHFGEHAELAGLIFQLPIVEASQKLSSKLLHTPKDLQAQALAELSAMAKKAERAKLTKVDLVLYDDGLGVMEPAYHLVMERTMVLGDQKPSMIPYDFYLPISQKPLAFFPHMDNALFIPEDGRDTKGGPIGKDD